jgi:hypothetical protein
MRLGRQQHHMQQMDSHDASAVTSVGAPLTIFLIDPHSAAMLSRTNGLRSSTLAMKDKLAL